MSYSEIRSSPVICKKPHSCEWCAERIEVGSQAQYRVYVFDGEFTSGHMHSECFDAMLKVDVSDLREGWTPGDYARGSTSDEPGSKEVES